MASDVPGAATSPSSSSPSPINPSALVAPSVATSPTPAPTPVGLTHFLSIVLCSQNLLIQGNEAPMRLESTAELDTIVKAAQAEKLKRLLEKTGLIFHISPLRGSHK